MTYLITPPSVMGFARIELPTSKSITNRALMIQALAGEECKLNRIATCDDALAMKNALDNNPEVVDVGAAGTAMRFLTAYYAIQEGERHVMTGSPRMLQRPIGPLVEALRTLGADITYLGEEGFPPLQVVGRKLKGGSVEVPGSISSQFISALLMIAPYMEQPLELALTGDIASIPYIHMTVSMMTEFGAEVSWHGRRMLRCTTKPYQAREYTVEPDWSAASYWFEILGLASVYASGLVSVQLPNLNIDSVQGDCEIFHLFAEKMHLVTYSCKHNLVSAELEVEAPFLLRCDFTHHPDLAQTVVVTCCMLDIPFIFNGLESLYIKETNRVEALKNELYKLGFDLHDDGAGMLTWQRGKHRRRSKPVINTYNDHRMALAFAPCCLRYGEIRIANPEVVSKSYPGYWDDLRTMGFNITEIPDK